MSENEAGAAAPEKIKKPKWQPPELTQEIQDQLEEKYEDILILRGGDMSPWVAVIRRMTRPESLVYKSNNRKTEGNQSVLANEQLIRAIAVWPPANVIDAQIAKWPMFPDGIVQNAKFKEFVGVSADADLKG